MDFVSDDQRKAVMSRLHPKHDISSFSIHGSKTGIMPMSQKNKMLSVVCDWHDAEDCCPFCDGAVQAASTDNHILNMCKKCHSTKMGNQTWKWAGDGISQKDLSTALRKLELPQTTVSHLWNFLPPEAKETIIRTGSNNRQYGELFKLGTYVLKLEWNKLNTLGQFLFERGLEKVGSNRIYNYQITEKRPKNMQNGFQSALTGKWYSWETRN